MITAKWTTNTGEQQDLHYPAARFNGKGLRFRAGIRSSLSWFLSKWTFMTERSAKKLLF
jgi:hypothetical protein